MITRSTKLYALGYLAGAFTGLIIAFFVPSFYNFLIELLVKKIEIQQSIIKDPTINLSVNNLLASGISAFGGIITTLIMLRTENSRNSKTLTRILLKLDSRISKLKRGELKLYISLFLFPFFSLFLNGGILGIFLILYLETPQEYIANLFPHGVFEIPAIILSASIGFNIAEKGLNSLLKNKTLRKDILSEFKRNIKAYLFVMFLILAGSVLESKKVYLL